MTSIYLLMLAIGLLVLVDTSNAIAQEYDYEYGTKGIGDGSTWKTNGNIGPFQYHTVVDIPVPPGKTVTYVSVQVWALTPPDVKIDLIRNQVIIDYSIVQLTLSDYEIYVEYGREWDKRGSRETIRASPAKAH